jgi:ketosteroid isomerase-like protein
MKRMFLPFLLVLVLPLVAAATSEEDSVRKAVSTYDQAVAKKDVEVVRTLLAPEMLLYEHSVRNDGAKDAFENHLKPEILEADGLQLLFSDLRVTANSGLALVTRQYQVKGTFQGKAVDSTGNETQVWKQSGGQWKLIHIHYSHPCPRPKSHS